MKRRISFFLAVLLLFTASAIFIPIHAAEDASFATLKYTYASDGDNNEAQGGIVADEIRFSRAVTITWDASLASLKLDGAAVQGDSLLLEQAGRYKLTVTKNGGSETHSYTVYVLPNVNVADRQVFISYPVIECTNAQKMSLDIDKVDGVRDFQSGTAVTRLGMHILTIQGENGEKFSYTFYIKLCTATQRFDEALGKYCLDITVGEFEDTEFSVMLDGKQTLQTGSNLVSAVGKHTLSAVVNGEQTQSASLFPSGKELDLQVDLTVPSGDLKQPLTFLFSRYDASFYLLEGFDEATGTCKKEKRIEGDYRLEEHGSHVIVAKDEAGNVVQEAFLIRRAEEDEGTSDTYLRISFDNPHRFYVIFLIVPSALLLCLALWFLLKRRRIV